MKKHGGIIVLVIALLFAVFAFGTLASNHKKVQEQSKINNKEWLGFDPDEEIERSKAWLEDFNKRFEEMKESHKSLFD